MVASAYVLWFSKLLAFWLEGEKWVSCSESENYCTTQGKHSGYMVTGSERCGSEMIPIECNN